MLHGEPVLRQTPLQSYSVRAVPRTHVVPRSCFAQDIGSYKAYAVCTCNLTLTSRNYRNGGPPIGSHGLGGGQLLSLPPE